MLVRDVLEAPYTRLAITTVFECMPALDLETLLLKIPHTLVARYGEIRLELTLAVVVPEGTLQTAAGKAVIHNLVR